MSGSLVKEEVMSFYCAPCLLISLDEAVLSNNTEVDDGIEALLVSVGPMAEGHRRSSGWWWWKRDDRPGLRVSTADPRSTGSEANNLDATPYKHATTILLQSTHPPAMYLNDAVLS